MPRTKLKRVIALLLDSDSVLKSKYALAKKTGASQSWVVKLTKKLEKKGLVKGLKVTNAKGLFEMFHAIRPKKQETRAYATYNLGNIDQLINMLKKSTREYAFTTYVAENLVQKYLFSHRTDIYIKKEDLDEWHNEFTKIGTYGGGNVRLIVATHDELFNKKQVKPEEPGPWIVSTPQLISDLYAEGGPAKEAGDMLLEKLTQSIGAGKHVSRQLD